MTDLDQFPKNDNGNLLSTLVKCVDRMLCNKPYCDITHVAKGKESGHQTLRRPYVTML